MSKIINVAVSGFGKMGQILVDFIKKDPQLNLSCIIDHSEKEADFDSVCPKSLNQVEVIMDFTRADNVLSLVKKVAQINPKIKILSGTTGWGKDEAKVRKIVTQKKLFFLFATNFSVGTNLFFKIVDYAVGLFNHFENFDPAILEIHHCHKADMPSGTSKKIGQIILDKIERKSKVLMGMSNRAIKPNELHLASLRTGENKGMHQVTFDSQEEVISLSQQTRDRATYIQGSLLALKWLLGQKKPGFYSFDDCLKNIIN